MWWVWRMRWMRRMGWMLAISKQGQKKKQKYCYPFHDNPRFCPVPPEEMRPKTWALQVIPSI